MNFEIKYESFETYSEAEKYATQLLTFEELIEKYRNFQVAERQHVVINKVHILGKYDTMLFMRYEIS
jgi:hypothetical protein